MPSGIHDVTAQWLTAALGRPVAAVRAEQIAQDSGFSSLLYRLHLTGDGLPATVIAKLPAESEARGAMELLGGYRRELAFYQRVAGRAPMQTPRVYTARIVDGTADFVLLLEDLAHWDNADHLAGLSMDRARICIDALAGLHAWSTVQYRCARGVPEHRHPDRARPAGARVRAGVAGLPREVVGTLSPRRSTRSPSSSPSVRSRRCLR